MLPRVLACLTIVAAFPVWLDAAPPISEDLPVPVEVAAVARSLGLEPPRDRARFVAELARLLYTPPFGKSAAAAALLNPQLIDPEMAEGLQPFLAPLPLSADVWSRSIFKKPIAPERLVAAIMADRRAALICYALAALDDETLGFLAQHSGLLTRLYENSAAAFAAFGAGLRIEGDRVVPPGGAGAVPLWEGIVRERVADPEAFVRALFALHDGRLAYLYDTIGQLDAPHAAFALGAWMADPHVRLVRFAALVEVCARSYREWRVDVLPFSKPLHDLGILLLRLRVEANGAPAVPGSRAFWTKVFESDDLNPGSVSLPSDADLAPLDAAWLAETTSSSDVFWRSDRMDQFAFGQRLITSLRPEGWPAAVVAIRAFPKQRMLSLTLERIGVKDVALYAAIARQAHRLTSGSPSHLFATLAQVQSLIAMVTRMTEVGTLTGSVAERLVTSLFALPLDGDRRPGAVAAWFDRELLPLLPVTKPEDSLDNLENRLIAGLAGPDPGRAAPRIQWEGQQYRVDLPHGERQRLGIVRRKQEGYGVDLAMALYGVARTLASDGLAIDTVRKLSADVAALPGLHEKRSYSPPEWRAVGVESPSPLADRLERVTEDLARSIRNNDVRRAARLAPAVYEIVETLLGDALLSLAYAADLGDPEGPAMLARNVALRHDFGFGRKDTESRARSIWAVPRQDFLPGVPWHVAGSVLGLDIAMASLALRRISPDRLADAPRLPSNEREAFAVSLTLMNPRRLTDVDRDAIAAAIARGRARVTAMTAGSAFDEVAGQLDLDGWRRRSISWMLTNDRGYIPEMFSLVELLRLGDPPAQVDLIAWGTTGLQSKGCACLEMRTPGTWRLLSGRPQMALMAAGIPDLNLFIAMVLADMKLPAVLARSVLASAVLDFIESVGPTDPNDWWSVVRAARTVRRELIEDYVAAAAAVGGPLVPDDTETSQP